MKMILKYIPICLVVALLTISCKSLSITEPNNNFVILNTGDTIYGKKIRFSRAFNKIGKVKVVKSNGEKQVFGYDKIYQVHKYLKNGSFRVEEMVQLTPNNPVSYTLMDIHINSGKVKLYQHDPTNFPNTPFVVSDIFYGYVRTQTEFNSLLSKLDTCVAFRGKFSDNEQRKKTSLGKFITYYNAHCE